MKKKILSSIVLIGIVISCVFALNVGAATEGRPEGNYTYTVSDGCATITQFNLLASSDELQIPSYLGGYPVKHIGDYAFKYAYFYNNIIIPEGVISIGDGAFSYTDLTNITIPKNVTSVGTRIFENCYYLERINWNANISDFLKYSGGLFSSETGKYSDGIEIVFGDNVNTIPAYMFNSTDDSITSVVIGNSVRTIGKEAFYGCNALTSITIPESVTSIGAYAFADCDNLEYINWYARDVNDYATSAFFGSGTSTDGVKVVFGDNVSTIPSNAFTSIGDSLTEVVIGNSVKTIDDSAFYGCNALTSITIPESVTSVGYNAFADCVNLERINWNAVNANINDRGYLNPVFSNAGKEVSGVNVVFGDNVEVIPKNIFSNNENVTSVVMGSTVESIGTSAFLGCTSLKSVSMNDALISVGANAFYDCVSLESITIPNSVESIGANVLYNCPALTEITIPFIGASRTAGGAVDGVFGYLFGKPTSGEFVVANQHYSTEYYVTYCIPTKLQKVYITDAIQIPYGAFDGCIGVDYIEINEGVTQISQSAFINCDFLSVYMPKSVSKIGTGAFLGTDVEKLYVSKNSYCHEYAEANNYAYEFYDSDDLASVTGVSLNKSAIEMAKGNTYKLIANVLPEDATDKTVIWKSSNTSIATVANGIVTAVSEGSATITVTTVDGGYTDKCVVTVSEIESNEPIDENTPQVIVSSVKSMAGDTISVDVSIANNPGFVSLGLEIEYDSDYLTLTNIKSESGVGATFTAAQSYTKMPYNFGWSSTDNIYYNGKLATLTFTINENAPDGTYPIALSYYKGVSGNYTDGYDVNYDENFEAIGLAYVSGNIAIVSYTPGDINGDSNVTDRDATFLLRYLAGWNQSGIIEEALDVDGSGTINDRDATTLLRYLAGWDVELH